MTESLTDTNPQFTAVKEDWTLMRDAYKGERQVKSKGIIYLPFTASHIYDRAHLDVNGIGYQNYIGYRKRARFPNFVREAIQMAIGMMHSQPPIIKLPKEMENIRSSKNELLPDLLRRINTEQLLTGRVGIMADLAKNPRQGEDLPYISLYHTERLINWDDGTSNGLVPQELNLVVIDESESERTSGLAWTVKQKHRVLVLGSVEQNQSIGEYRQAVFENNNFNESALKAPSWRGRKLDRIPFEFINSCDLSPDVDDPPLLDLGNICMAIYRGEADYRQNLYMQGQDTFVTIGAGFDEDDSVRVGAGARLDLPTGADAKYVGVESSGLAEQRTALTSLEARAGTMGAQTLDSTSRERESGDSLRIRVAARTADMNQIVETGARGLENLLKTCAEWMGENPDEVEVIPNKDFGEAELTGQTMVEMATARTLGFPLSAKSMHNIARKRRMTDLTFEEEMAEAKKEEGEEHPFKKPETADRAGSDQNGEGDDTSDDKSARNKAKSGDE